MRDQQQKRGRRYAAYACRVEASDAEALTKEFIISQY